MSAVLAFLLQQPEGDATRDLWVENRNRVSSILLRAECLVNLRRNASRLPPGQSRAWLKERPALLASCMEDITLADMDASILEALLDEEKLSDCRTLDALHLATALRFSSRADEGLVVVSLDEKMRQTAKKLKFEVLPAA